MAARDCPRRSRLAVPLRRGGGSVHRACEMQAASYATAIGALLIELSGNVEVHEGRVSGHSPIQELLIHAPKKCHGVVDVALLCVEFPDAHNGRRTSPVMSSAVNSSIAGRNTSSLGNAPTSAASAEAVLSRALSRASPMRSASDSAFTQAQSRARSTRRHVRSGLAAVIG